MTAMTYTTATRRIGRAEWTKLRTMPSTWRTAVITAVIAAGFGVAVAYSQMGTAAIERLARERLGFAQLRPGQVPAVAALAGGRDVLAVLPTGAGKSAIYELAGLLRAGPTVVVSPLIALEDDQLAHLRRPDCMPSS